MAGPDHVPFVDTSVAVSRLLNGKARVRRAEWRLSPSQRRQLADLVPDDLSPDLIQAVEWAIDSYRSRGMGERVSKSYRKLKRPMFVARLKRARALERLLDPVIDRALLVVLRKAMRDWDQLAELVPGNPPHRPTDAAMTKLGVAVVDALERDGIPLKTHSRALTALMEILDFVRACAEPHVKPLTVQGSCKFAKRSIAAWERRVTEVI
jgi:hypothetical protein